MRAPPIGPILTALLVAWPALAQTSTSTTGGEFAVYTDTNGVTVFTPTAQATLAKDKYAATGQYLVDIVSAASVDIISTASAPWTEARQAASLSVAYRDDVSTELSGYLSYEPDTLSLTGTNLWTLELANEQVLPSIGYGLTHDTIGRVDTPFAAYAQRVWRHQLITAVELVLDRSTTGFVELDLGLDVGDQKKPYRSLPLFASNVAEHVSRGASLAEVNRLRLPGSIVERVPSERKHLALSGRLARRFAHSTFNAFVRGYADDWALLAATSDLRLTLDLGRRWLLWAHARGHLQSGVSFWQRAYTSQVLEQRVLVPEFRTGDRELGPLLSVTGGAGTDLGLGPAFAPRSLLLSLQIEQMYTSFLDAIYLKRRWAQLFALRLGVEL